MTALPVSTTFLEADDMHLSFGGIAALRGVSFTVREQRVLRDHRAERRRQDVPLLNVLNGVYPADLGRDPGSRATPLTGRRPARHRPRLGVARTFQNVALFEDHDRASTT